MRSWPGRRACGWSTRPSRRACRRRSSAPGLLIGTRLAAGAVFAFPPANGEDSVGLLLRHPAHMGGSDGIYVRAGTRTPAAGARSPGCWAGTCASAATGRGSRRWCTSRRTRPGGSVWQTAGCCAAGLAADLVVFDPATVIDRAGYEAPRELATGVADVVVNGVPVLAGGRLTGARPGTPLRPR